MILEREAGTSSGQRLWRNMPTQVLITTRRFELETHLACFDTDAKPQPTLRWRDFQLYSYMTFTVNSPPGHHLESTYSDESSFSTKGWSGLGTTKSSQEA